MREAAAARRPRLPLTLTLLTGAVLAALLLNVALLRSPPRPPPLPLRSAVAIERRDATGPVRPIPPLKRREDIAELLQREGKRHGAELGVLWGNFAVHTLAHWQACETYLLVDLWAHQENYKDVSNLANTQHEDNMQRTLAQLAPWEAKLRVCRNYTTACAREVTNGSLDYVYVDARHDRKGVAEDLEHWWPKLREGGILAGHDYVTQDDGPAQTGQDWTKNADGTVDETGEIVVGAVNDFAQRVGRQVLVTYREAEWNTWLMRK